MTDESSLPATSTVAVEDLPADHGAGVARPHAGPEHRAATRWTWLRRTAWVVYLGVVGTTAAVDGPPTDRLNIAILIVVALMITRLGQSWRRLGQVILDWLPFTLVLLAYDQTRGIADRIGLPLHVADVVGWEKAISFGTVPTVWLQQHLYDPHHVYWYDALCTLIYTSHFLATPVLAATLWLRERAAWLRFISRVIVLSVAGLVTYVLFPEAPPWYASRHGVIADHVARLSARGWSWFHIGDLRTMLANAQKDGSNPVAAMPSLHVAFACLVALFIATRLQSRWRVLLAAYPLAMAFTLVYTGEHYVVDLIAGLAYALVVHLGLARFERRRAATRQHAPAPVPAPSTAPSSAR